MPPRTEFETQRAQMAQELEQIAPEPLRSKLGAMIRPAIEIETFPSTGELPPRASKFGGAPDVPLGFEWPHFKGEPLSFVAQFNLEELAPFDLKNRLPKSGLLSFWTNWAEGRVFHFQGEEWQKQEMPQRPNPRTWWDKWKSFRTPKPPTFLPSPLEFSVWASHPWRCAEFYAEEQKLEDKQIARNLDEAMPYSGHRMFGFPESVQNDVRDECAHDWNEFLNTPEAQEWGLSPELDQTTWRDWQLLLQMGEDDHAKMEWGDVFIYFLIRHIDLEAHRFERCWFASQCS